MSSGVLGPGQSSSGSKRYQPSLWEKLLTYICAVLVVFVVLFVVLYSFLFGKPLDQTGLLLLRILVSFALGVLTASVTGYLNVDLSYKGLAIRAGAGFAVFVLVYFFNPPSLVSQQLLLERPYLSISVQPFEDTNEYLKIYHTGNSVTTEVRFVLKNTGRSAAVDIQPGLDAFAKSGDRQLNITSYEPGSYSTIAPGEALASNFISEITVDDPGPTAQRIRELGPVIVTALWTYRGILDNGEYKTKVVVAVSPKTVSIKEMHME